MIAAAVTGGRLTLEGATGDHLGGFLDVLSRMGVPFTCGRRSVEVDATTVGPGAFRPTDIRTGAYPGLATDLQPPTCVLLTQGNGRSTVHEAIFEDRLEWLGELGRMGASIELLDEHHAAIDGPAQLHGAEVEIGDLRAGASLILAAVAADGPSTIHGAHHVHRGYEDIERKFLDVGAKIERLAEGGVPAGA